jgi:hypothetical protein
MSSSSKKSTKSRDNVCFEIDRATSNIRGKHRDFFVDSDGKPSKDLFRGIHNDSIMVSVSKYDHKKDGFTRACKKKTINKKHINILYGEEVDIVEKFKHNQIRGAEVFHDNALAGHFIPIEGKEETFNTEIKWNANSSPFK